VPWQIAMTRENIQGGFERTGLYPLSLERMLSGIVGNVAVDNSTPMVAEALKNICITKRAEVKWKGLGLDMNAMRVVVENLDRLVENMINRRTTRKDNGGFVPEPLAKRLSHGGLLMTADDVLAVLEQQRVAKELKDQAIAESKAKTAQIRALKLTAAVMKLEKSENVILV
jgi:hypothetical protein